jgi:hypothetical protein
MTDSKNGSKSNLNESNMPLLSEEAAEKGGDTPEKEVIEMTETEKVRSPVKKTNSAKVCHNSLFKTLFLSSKNICYSDIIVVYTELRFIVSSTPFVGTSKQTLPCRNRKICSAN